jgi:hypothetical protein
MKLWMRGCAAATLVAAMAGQAFAEEVFVRSVPLVGVQSLPPEDDWNAADVALPPGVMPGTLDAQMVRWRAAHPDIPQTAVAAGADAPTMAAPPMRLAAERPVASPEHMNPRAERAAEPAHMAMAPQEPQHMAMAAMAPGAAPPPEAAPQASVAPPPPEGFVLASRLLDDASAFDDYTRGAAGLNADFADPAAVNRAVRLGAAYEPHQLASGAAAYVAVMALQDARFVAEVRAAAANDPQFAERVLYSPSEVLSVAGAARAGGRAQAVLYARGVAVAQAGAAVRQAAYDVQHQPWSRGFVADPGGLLERVKLDSNQVVHADPERVGRMMRAVSGPLGGAGEGGRLAPAVTRGLALAALAVIGQAGEANAERIEVMLADGSDAACLHMAKLNLFQCMAVAGPQYEDLFCTGQHAVADTGRCMIAQASGGPGDPGPAMDVARAEPEPQPYGERTERRYDAPTR